MAIINVPTNAVATLKNWRSGTNETNGEAILVLELHGLPGVIVQMNHIAAREMGNALVQLANQIAPKSVN